MSLNHLIEIDRGLTDELKLGCLELKVKTQDNLNVIDFKPITRGLAGQIMKITPAPDNKVFFGAIDHTINVVSFSPVFTHTATNFSVTRYGLDSGIMYRLQGDTFNVVIPFYFTPNILNVTLDGVFFVTYPNPIALPPRRYRGAVTGHLPSGEVLVGQVEIDITNVAQLQVRFIAFATIVGSYECSLEIPIDII